MCFVFSSFWMANSSMWGTCFLTAITVVNVMLFVGEMRLLWNIQQGWCCFDPFVFYSLLGIEYHFGDFLLKVNYASLLEYDITDLDIMFSFITDTQKLF